MDGDTRINITAFVNQHDLDVDGQFKCLVEEVGEVAEMLNTDSSNDELAEELADVIFVAYSIGMLEHVDVDGALNTVAAENAQKDRTTAGSKVTKE